MSTHRIYYTEPAVVEFEAGVTACDPDSEHTGRWRVTLDRTAFYPTSGGQPHDIGTLGETPVLDVVESESGDVQHLVAGPLEPGQRVYGRVDAARRRDHMQQHTGQHVLSAAFSRLLAVRTESFHLGTHATIDLAREVTPAEIAAAEDEANRVVWEDRPVGIRFVPRAEAGMLDLRKEPVREGELRLIDIEDFDLSACGGTHVTRTGEIGVIAVRAWERFKGASRLEFVCGRRALGAFRDLRDVVTASVKQLSVLPLELPAAIERTLIETRDLRRELRGRSEQLARYQARELAAGAMPVSGWWLVAEVIAGHDAGGLKVLASSLTALPGRLVVLLTAERPSMIVIARSSDVPVDASAVLKRLIQQFGGKGGGKADLAQAGGLNAPPPEIVALARHLIEQVTATK
jgi:alanyl-tRNA synthetase